MIRQYDHEVQGRSVIKPLAGPGAGPSDAAVLRPRLNSPRGIALGCGLCPHRSDDDPYWMAVAAVDEALRNVICVGGDPDHTAMLDNFCWPRCDSEAMMGALVRACRGAADAAVAYGLPFISGKDSLNNEFSMDPEEAARLGLPQRMAIPPTLLVSAISVIDDVSRCVSMDLKAADNLIVLASAPVDMLGLKTARGVHSKVADLVRSGRVLAAHDVSDGGIAVALAEMCIAGGMGVDATLHGVGGLDAFDDAPTSYLLEVPQRVAIQSRWVIVGRVTAEPVVRLTTPHGDASWDIGELASAWRSPLARGGA
ncbi:MAG: hypothetical protein C4547_11645 [Phycisphaerales bacterium]|nr:MAG: hypothetical protein C4547_11645 [Phycisphaerales bacterium]